MKILVVDAGNSQTKASLWTGAPGEHPAAIVGMGTGSAKPLPEIHVAATPRDEAGAAELARVLATAARRAGAGSTVLISVVPRLEAALAAALPGIFRVDHGSPLSSSTRGSPILMASAFIDAPDA